MSAALAPLGRILSAREAGLYRDAAEALRVADSRAVARRAEAEAECAALRARVLSEAQQEGRGRVAAMEAAAAARFAANRDALRTEIATAVADGVAKVLGAMPVAEAVAAAAATALAELDTRHGVAVHVNPEAVPAVRAALAGWGDACRVASDAALPRDACTIETESGIVRAGLADQLALLRAAILDAAAHG